MGNSIRFIICFILAFLSCEVGLYYFNLNFSQANEFVEGSFSIKAEEIEYPKLSNECFKNEYHSLIGKRLANLNFYPFNAYTYKIGSYRKDLAKRSGTIIVLNQTNIVVSISCPKENG